ncbi:DUF305 domain-containing protein [Methanobacterium sp. ACI-7]|uniref:DUF305 domain-containing protein n=1 Tax=unclassified Methanobacterium TaxID=2627676 RepID=UPI0039C095EF
MKNNPLTLALLAIIIILVGLVAFLVFFVGFSMMRDGMMGNHDNSGMMGDVDRHFIEQMIPHHDDAIAMANIASTKAEHQETKQLAENIKRDQSREIAQMREFYKRTYGADVPVSSGMMGSGEGRGGRMMGDSTDLTELENAKPFDKAFIEEMVPHHRMAIMMANMLLNRSNNPEMRALAESIIKTQSDEIDQMKSWYREWYGQPLVESSR